eukprot:scaffold136602_cov52-Attheya_sp.AAC.1
MRRGVDYPDYQAAGSPSTEMKSSGRRLSGGQQQPSSLTIGSRSTSKSSSSNSDSWQQSINSHDSLGELPFFPRRGSSSATFARDSIVSGVPTSPDNDNDNDNDNDLDSPPPRRQQQHSHAHEEFTDEENLKTPRRGSLVRWADEEGAAPLEHHAPSPSASLTADQYFEALIEPLQRELDKSAMPSPDGILRDKRTSRKPFRSSTDAEKGLLLPLLPLKEEENPSTSAAAAGAGGRKKKKKKKKSSSSEGQDDHHHHHHHHHDHDPTKKKKKKKKKKRLQIQDETEEISFNQGDTQLWEKPLKKEDESVSISLTDTYDTVSLSTESSTLNIPTTNRTRALATNFGKVPTYQETDVVDITTEGVALTEEKKNGRRSVSFGPSGYLEENYEYDPTGPVQRYTPSDTSSNNSAAAPQPPPGVLRGAQSGSANRPPNHTRRTSFAANVLLPPETPSSISSPATESPPSSPTPGHFQVSEPSQSRRGSSVSVSSSSVSVRSFASSHRSQRHSFGSGREPSMYMDHWDDHSTAGGSLAGASLAGASLAGASLAGVSIGGASASSHFSRRSMSMMLSQRTSALSLAATSTTSDSRDGKAKDVRTITRGSRTNQMFDQTGHVLSETEMVNTWKLLGKCTTCGITRTHLKTKYGPFKAFRRMEGITVAKKVYKGYCLRCHGIKDVKIFLGEDVSIDPEEDSSLSTPHTHSTPGIEDSLSSQIDPESQPSSRTEEDEDEDDIYESIVSGAAIHGNVTHPYESTREADAMMMFQNSGTGGMNYNDSFTGGNTFGGNNSGSTDYLMNKERFTLKRFMNSLRLKTFLMLSCIGLFGGLITLAINISRQQADVKVSFQSFPPTVSPTLAPTISAPPSSDPTSSPTYLDWNQLGQDIVETDIESFGFKVELSNAGNRLAVSAPHDSSFQQKAGQVVVYEYPTLGSMPTVLNKDEWVPLGQPILGEIQNDNAGWGMDLSGDGSTLAVGFPGNGNGYVRVYRYDNDTKQWEQKGNTIAGTQTDSGFGRAIDLSLNGDDIVIGAEHFDGPNGMNSGQVTVYNFDSIGKKWDIHGNQMNGVTANDVMGRSVAIGREGRVVLVGSPGNSERAFNAGRVSLFVLTEVGGTRLQWEVESRREVGKAAGDRLGHVVCISEESDEAGYYLGTASPGAEAKVTSAKDVGNVQLFQYAPLSDDPEYIEKTQSFDDNSVDGSVTIDFRFGNDFDMSGDVANVVIAEADDRSGPSTRPGKVHIYNNFFGLLNSLRDTHSDLDIEDLSLGPTRSVNGGPSVSASDYGQIAVGFESVIFPDSNITTSVVRVYDHSGTTDSQKVKM